MITEYFKTCVCGGGGGGDSITAEALRRRRWSQSLRNWGLEAVGGGFGDFRRSREWVSLKRSRDPRTSDCLGLTGRLSLFKFMCQKKKERTSSTTGAWDP